MTKKHDSDVDPVRDPDIVQNEDESIVTAQSADDLKGVKIPENFVPPKTSVLMNRTGEMGDEIPHDNLRAMASQIATDKTHPLHSLGAGLPFPKALLNILAILYGVLDTLHQGGLITPEPAKKAEKE